MFPVRSSWRRILGNIFEAKGLPPYPTSIFQKRVTGRIEHLFRGVHSKNVERHGKLCRGYKHIRLKA